MYSYKTQKRTVTAGLLFLDDVETLLIGEAWVLGAAINST